MISLHRCRSLALVMAFLLTTLAGFAWSASYSDGVLSDPANGFKINVPGNWNRQEMSNQGSNTHLFVSPDQNVAVAVTTFPGSGSTNLQQLLNTFQQTAVAGAQQLAVEPTDLNGLNGMLGAYRVQDANGPIITGAFATQSNGNGYVVWSMVPEAMYNSRYAESDAIMNTFSVIGTFPQPQVIIHPQDQPQVVAQSQAASGENLITVVSATYGENCGVEKGNVTDHIASSCNGKISCEYTVDTNVLGDPAYMCAKVYSVTYQCGYGAEVYKDFLPAEAGVGGKFVQLGCKNKLTAVTAAPAASKPKSASTTSGYHWFTEETSELRWQTPKSWPVEKLRGNPMLLPPAGDVLADAGGIKVQNMDRNVSKYRNVGSTVDEMMAFISSQKGTLLSSGQQNINGLNCNVAEFLVALGEESHHMWFIHVERPKVITLIQYDAYGTVFERQRLAKAMRPHVDLCLDTLRDMNASGSVQAASVSMPQPKIGKLW